MTSAIAEFIPARQSVPLMQRFGDRYGVDPGKMMATLKATCFNDKGGIVPVVSVDGWARIINEHPQMDGMDFEGPDDGASLTCSIHRKDRTHPTKITEYMTEVRRDTQPWKSHPRRMLRHKTVIQCARLAFGFAGIYDEDEAERIVEASKNSPDQEAAEAAERLQQAVTALSGSIATIKAGIESGELDKAAEAWYELTDDEQRSIYVAPTMNVKGKRVPRPNAPFTTHERDVIHSAEFRKAHFGEGQNEA